MQTNQNGPEENMEYLRFFIDRCWLASQHYKEDLNKLMIWLGSIFIGLIAVTGLFGAARQSGLVFSFTIVHVILFHIIFAIFWFFYLHKKLRAEMYLRIGIEAERYFTKITGTNPKEKIPSFFDTERYYLDRRFTLARVAVCLIFLLYICLIITPIISGCYDGKGVTINYESLICLSIYGLMLFIGQILYKSEKKHVMDKVQKEWETAVR